jgi:hypothetical protein
MEPDGEWRQLTNFGSPEVIVIGKRKASDTGSLREWVEQNGHKEA